MAAVAVGGGGGWWSLARQRGEVEQLLGVHS